MSKYKFSVGQRVLHKDVNRVVLDRFDLGGEGDSANEYILLVSAGKFTQAYESELTAIKEKCRN